MNQSSDEFSCHEPQPTSLSFGKHSDMLYNPVIRSSSSLPLDKKEERKIVLCSTVRRDLQSRVNHIHIYSTQTKKSPHHSYSARLCTLLDPSPWRRNRQASVKFDNNNNGGSIKFRRPAKDQRWARLSLASGKYSNWSYQVQPTFPVYLCRDPQ